MISVSFVLLLFTKLCFSVKDCTVVLKNPGLNTKKAVCDIPFPKMTEIPSDLPETITELEISHQNLRVLHHKKFTHLPNLVWLSITSSNIQFIEEGAFIMLSKLETLILSNNSILISWEGEFKLSASVFLPLLSLRKIDVSYNMIKTIPDFFFNHLNTTLEEIILSHSKCHLQIKKNSLLYLVNIKKLHIEFCNISTFQSDIESSLNTMVNLKEITLFGNPWNCNCQIKWLVFWIVRKLRMNPAFNLGHSPLCHEPAAMNRKSIFRKTYKSISNDEFQCRPQIMTLNSTVVGHVGQNISLTCIFENLEENHEIFWVRQSNIMTKKVMNERFLLVETEGKFRKSTLTILNFTKADEGSWRCLIKNEGNVIGAQYLIEFNSLTFDGGGLSSVSSVVYISLSISISVFVSVALMLLIYYLKYYNRALLVNNRRKLRFFTDSNSSKLFYNIINKKIDIKIKNPFSTTNSCKIGDEKIYDDVPVSGGLYINYMKKKNEQNYSTLNCLDCQSYSVINSDLKLEGYDQDQSPTFWYLDDNSEDYVSALNVDENPLNVFDDSRAVITRIPSRTPCPIHSNEIISESQNDGSIPDINKDILDSVQINSCPVHGIKSSAFSTSVKFSIPHNINGDAPLDATSESRPKPSRYSSFHYPLKKKVRCTNSFDRHTKRISEDRHYSCLSNSLV